MLGISCFPDQNKNMPSLRIIDSITELNTSDIGCMAVSGSHGGISSARFALAVRPLLTVFNDAGGGLDSAGLAALKLMEQHNLAACTVAHCTARIGEAQSTLSSGVVSHINTLAQALGIEVGWTCRRSADFILASRKGSP